MKRRKVWVEIWPIYAVKGVVLKKNFFLGSYVLFRDFNGKCFREWFKNYQLIDRP